MTETAKVQDEQETANVKLYARVFRKCFDEAVGIGADKRWNEEKTYETAKVLFDRFWADQAAVRKAAAEGSAVPE